LNYPPNTAKVFIGDSMTEGFDLDRHFESSNLVNMGIGGDFTSGVINRLKYATRLQPKSIFIMIGINDILKNIDMHRITSQYTTILEILKAECPDAFLCVQSNLPTSMMGGSVESNKSILDRVQELNTFLKIYCSEHSIYFADMYASFVTPQGDLKSDCTYDGLHLSEAGYLIWKDTIQKLVDN
jgi:lysophospholipase L1-like esterase